jgi:phosphate transport system substrate-binding protein
MKSLKTIMAGALVAATFAGTGLANAASSVALNGAGATFPYPIYSKWFYEYNKATGVQVNYQSIGSGGGVQQFTAKTVDFGASDAFLTDDETAKVKGNVIHLPTVVGSEPIVYNIPGVGSGLKLTPEVLVGIYLGDITKWNDPKITALNPDMALPDLNITVAHRSDGSGTTNIFTNYLTKVSTKWASTVGWGKAVKWPVGVGGKGNEGVAGLVKQIPGTIGYVELAYAEANNMNVCLLRNKAGKFVKATVDSTIAAAAGALRKMPADFKVMITNSSGEDAYPITGFTWLLVYPKYDDPVKGKAVVDMLKWIYSADGRAMCGPLFYGSMPDSVVEKINAKIDEIKY